MPLLTVLELLSVSKSCWLLCKFVPVKLVYGVKNFAELYPGGL